MAKEMDSGRPGLPSCERDNVAGGRVVSTGDVGAVSRR
jgi:hypothetical protein